MYEEIKLHAPFKNAEGVMQHTVKMRTLLLVGDWRWANKQTKDPEDRTFWMLTRLCGLLTEELEQLSMADFQALAEKMDLGDADPKA